jgi:putative oxidoreductase
VGAIDLPPPRLGIEPRLVWSLIRVVSAIVFIVFGVGKFVHHGDETASFRGYGLPAPGVFTLVIGVVELLGGVALIVGPAGGFARRLALVLLAGDMIAAIILSGILHGEKVSLTLAPALLVSMLVLGAMELGWTPGARAGRSS